MTRIKRGIIANKRRKNLLKKTKGYKYGRNKKLKAAKSAWIKAKGYAYRDRRQKKRDFRRLWNVRINAALKDQGLNFSRFMNGLKKNGIELNRKMLSTLADSNPEIFSHIVKTVKK